MDELPLVVEPYIRGDLRLDGIAAPLWARALDHYCIQWDIEPVNRLETTDIQDCELSARFHLSEMNMLLEVMTYPTGAVRTNRRGSIQPIPGPLVILGYPNGDFLFRDRQATEQLDLFMHCPSCDKFFFSYCLETPCGFCRAPKPIIRAQQQIYLSATRDLSCQSSRDLRPMVEQTLRDQSSRHRHSFILSLELPANGLFDDQEAEKATARETGSWERLKDSLSGPVFTHQWPTHEKIEALNADYPNFTEVCEFISREIKLSRHRPTKAVKLPNLLLVGGPSCGKSSFSERLARILVDTDFTRIDLGQATTNFALVGSDSGFKNGKEGRILRLMAGDPGTKPVSNPMVILDELDKAFRETTFNPLPALLSLMEKRDAKRFVDEFFTVPIDASGLNFLALANTLRPLSDPLLSRFTVFQIQDYTREEFVDVVIPAIYRDWSSQFFPGTFPAVLSQKTRREIADASGDIPRRVSTILNQLVFTDHAELVPSPTWEVIGSDCRAPDSGRELSK